MATGVRPQAELLVSGDFQSNFHTSDTSFELSLRREGCFASGAVSVRSYTTQKETVTPTATDAFIHSHFIIRETVPTLCSVWIKGIRTKHATCLLYMRSVFTWQNLLILLSANPHPTPCYKHILRLLLRSWP